MSARQCHKAHDLSAFDGKRQNCREKLMKRAEANAALSARR